MAAISHPVPVEEAVMRINQKTRIFSCAVLVYGAAACGGESVRAHGGVVPTVAHGGVVPTVAPAAAKSTIANPTVALDVSSEPRASDARVYYPLAEVGGRGFARRAPHLRAPLRRPTIEEIQAPPAGSGATAIAAHLLTRMDTTAEAPRRTGRAAEPPGPRPGAEPRRDPNGPCELVARAADVRVERIPFGRRLVVTARRSGDLAELRLRLHPLESFEPDGRATDSNAPSSGCGLVDLARRGHEVEVGDIPGGVYIDIVPEQPSRVRLLDRALLRAFGARAMRPR